jgi:hypothetical protein
MLNEAMHPGPVHGHVSTSNGTSSWEVLRKNLQELKDMLSLDTKFRVKTRLLSKVSFVMHNHNPLTHHDINVSGSGELGETPPSSKKSFKLSSRPAPLRHSISEPANEKIFMEAAMASAAVAGLDLNPFKKKLPKGAESCLILATTASFATQPLLLFIKLEKPQIFRNYCEVNTPTRHVYSIMCTSIGSSLNTVFSIFQIYWYNCGPTIC